MIGCDLCMKETKESQRGLCVVPKTPWFKPKRCKTQTPFLQKRLPIWLKGGEWVCFKFYGKRLLPWMQSHGRCQHLEQNAVGGGNSTSNQPSGPRLSITTTKSPTGPRFLIDLTPCDWMRLMHERNKRKPKRIVCSAKNSMV